MIPIHIPGAWARVHALTLDWDDTGPSPGGRIDRGWGLICFVLFRMGGRSSGRRWPNHHQLGPPPDAVAAPDRDVRDHPPIGPGAYRRTRVLRIIVPSPPPAARAHLAVAYFASLRNHPPSRGHGMGSAACWSLTPLAQRRGTWFWCYRCCPVVVPWAGGIAQRQPLNRVGSQG